MKKNHIFCFTFSLLNVVLIPTLPDLRHKINLRPYQSKHHHEHHWGPFFEEPVNASQGALQVGIHLRTEAHLNCRVGMLRDKTVSWRKVLNFHIKYFVSFDINVMKNL